MQVGVYARLQLSQRVHAHAGRVCCEGQGVLWVQRLCAPWNKRCQEVSSKTSLDVFSDFSFRVRQDPPHWCRYLSFFWLIWCWTQVRAGAVETKRCWNPYVSTYAYIYLCGEMFLRPSTRQITDASWGPDVCLSMYVVFQSFDRKYKLPTRAHRVFYVFTHIVYHRRLHV